MTAKMRKQGLGYSKIAVRLGLSENTVKSYCRRAGLTGTAECIRQDEGQELSCRTCGVLVRQNPGRKEKKFCSDACRMKWWNSHKHLVRMKAVYEFECAFCKKPFTVYGNAGRKYCSHACYIADRFGGEGNVR